MAQGQNTAALIQFGISQIPTLVQGIEDAMGAGNGAVKNEIATQMLGTAVAGGAAIAAQNNPKYAPLAPSVMSLFSFFISLFVNGRKVAGVPVTATVPASATP